MTRPHNSQWLQGQFYGIIEDYFPRVPHCSYCACIQSKVNTKGIQFEYNWESIYQLPVIEAPNSLITMAANGA